MRRLVLLAVGSWPGSIKDLHRVGVSLVRQPTSGRRLRLLTTRLALRIVERNRPEGGNRRRCALLEVDVYLFAPSSSLPSASYQPALIIMHWPSPGGRWTR